MVMTDEEKQKLRERLMKAQQQRQAQGVQRPLAQIKQTEESIRQNQQSQARTEEEEAGRIAKILGGLKQGAQRNINRETIANAAKATGRGALATGRGLKAGGKWTWGAGGAVAGYGAAKAAGAKENAGKAKQWIGKKAAGAKEAAGKIAPYITPSGYTLFFILCCIIFLLDFTTNFGLNVGFRFVMYMLLAVIGIRFFERDKNFFRPLLITYLVFTVLLVVIPALPIPSNWTAMLPLLQIFYLAMFFVPGIKFGLSSFTISGIAFAAPIISWVFKSSFIAKYLPLTSSTILGVDIIASILAMAWLIYPALLLDWNATGNKKPLLIMIAMISFIVIIVLSGYKSYSELANQQNAQDIFGTADASAVAVNVRSAVVAGAKALVNDAKDLPNSIRVKSKEEWRKYMDFATAGYYTENVDAENIDTWVVEAPEAYAWKEEYKAAEAEAVTIEAVFAGSKKEDKKLYVTGVTKLQFGCRTKPKTGESPISGNATPKEAYLINLLGGQYSDTGQQSVTCTVPGVKKTSSVDIFAGFSFSAKSELGMLLTTAEKKVALANSNQLSQYETSPIAKSISPGPVTIALEFEEPYPIIAETSQVTQLKMTIEDHDDLYGRIQELNDLQIALPEGVKVDGCRARKDETTVVVSTKKVEAEENPDVEGETLTNVYELDTSGIEYPVDDFISFKCNIGFDEKVSELFSLRGTVEQIKEALKEGKDIVEEKITASTKYRYEIARSVRVNVVEIIPTSGSGTGTGGSCSGFTPDKSSLPAQRYQDAFSNYRSTIFSAAQQNTPSDLDSTSFAALISAILVKESQMGLDERAKAPSSGAGGITGCKPGDQGDSEEIRCAAELLKNAYDLPSQVSEAYTREGCPTKERNERWECILAVYNEGSPGDYNYASEVMGYWTTWKNYLCTGSSTPGSCGDIVDKAKEYLECPYYTISSGGTIPPDPSYCGKDRYGFTCATFVQTVVRRSRQASLSGNGDEICKRATSNGQAIPISKEQLQPGDLISILSGDYGHAGIYIGNNQIIHATSVTGRVVVGDLDRVLGGRNADFCRLKACT